MAKKYTRQRDRLTATGIRNLKRPGKYGDGQGLTLKIEQSKAKRRPGQGPLLIKFWVYRYLSPVTGAAREMGLGALHELDLAAARIKRQECADLIKEGTDPIDDRAAKKARKLGPDQGRVSFEQAAKRYLARREKGFRSEKHKAQWHSTLATYAHQKIGDKDVAAITRTDIIDIMERDDFWATKTETANRVRSRIEMVINFAIGRGWRPDDGMNPAALTPQLLDALASESFAKAKAASGHGKHFPALPFEQLPEFMQHLRAQDGVACLAMEFQILTASRSGSVFKAKLCEIDFEKKIWSVPASSMKMGKAHIVPLSPRAIEVVKKAQALLRPDIVTAKALVEAGYMPKSEFVRLFESGDVDPIPAEIDPEIPLFPTTFGWIGSDLVATQGRLSFLREGLSDGSFLALVKRLNMQREQAKLPLWTDPNMGGRAITPHGVSRSTFSDWAHSATCHPSEVIEMALAHTIQSKVQRAYLRGDLVEKRRALMLDWANYCAGIVAGQNVVSFPGVAGAA